MSPLPCTEGVEPPSSWPAMIFLEEFILQVVIIHYILLDDISNVGQSARAPKISHYEDEFHDLLFNLSGQVYWTTNFGLLQVVSIFPYLPN